MTSPDGPAPSPTQLPGIPTATPLPPLSGSPHVDGTPRFRSAAGGGRLQPLSPDASGAEHQDEPRMSGNDILQRLAERWGITDNISPISSVTATQSVAGSQSFSASDIEKALRARWGSVVS